MSAEAPELTQEPQAPQEPQPAAESARMRMARARARAWKWKQEQEPAASPAATGDDPHLAAAGEDWARQDQISRTRFKTWKAENRELLAGKTQREIDDLYEASPPPKMDPAREAFVTGKPWSSNVKGFGPDLPPPPDVDAHHVFRAEIGALVKVLDDLEQPDTSGEALSRTVVSAAGAFGKGFTGIQGQDYSKLAEAQEQIMRWVSATVNYRQERSRAAMSLGLHNRPDEFGGIGPDQYATLLASEGINELYRRAAKGTFDKSAVDEWAEGIMEFFGFGARVMTAGGIAKTLVDGAVKQGAVQLGILTASRAAVPLTEAERQIVLGTAPEDQVMAEASIRGMNAMREAVTLPVFHGVNVLGRFVGTKMFGEGLKGMLARGTVAAATFPAVAEVANLGFEGAVKSVLPAEEVGRLTEMSLLASPEMQGPVERASRILIGAAQGEDLDWRGLRGAAKDYAKAMAIDAPGFIGLNLVGMALARGNARPKDPKALGKWIEHNARAAVRELSAKSPKAAKQIEAFVNDQADAIKTLIDDQALGRYVLERMPKNEAQGPTRGQQQSDYLGQWKARQDMLTELRARAMGVAPGDAMPYLGVKSQATKSGRPVEAPSPAQRAQEPGQLGVGGSAKGAAGAGGKPLEPYLQPGEPAAKSDANLGLEAYQGQRPSGGGRGPLPEGVEQGAPVQEPGQLGLEAYAKRRSGAEGAEAGAVSVDLLTAPVRGAAKTAHAAVDNPVTRLWAEPLVSTVERGGGEVGKQVAHQARIGMDETRRLMGKWHDQLVQYQRTVRGPKVGNRARQKLEEVEWEHPLGGRTLFHRVLEGATSDAGLPPKAKEAIRGYERLYMTAGKGMQDAGTMIELREGWRPFRVGETKHMTRHPNQRGRDIAAAGHGPEHEAWVRSAVESPINVRAGITREIVEQEINYIGGRNVHGRYATEHRRVIPWMPDTIRVTPESPPIRIMDVDPFTAGTALVRGAARRLGYIKAFGQDVPGREGMSSVETIEAYRKAGGNPQALINLQRAMSGIALEAPPAWAKGNEYAYQAAQTGAAVATLWKAGKLTWSAPANVFEPAGKPAAMLGYGNVARAYVEAAKHPLDVYHDLAALGSVAPQVSRWYLEQGAKIHSAARNVGQVGTAPFQATQRIAEVITGKAAQYVVEQMKEGKSWPALRAGLRTMGFVEDEVKAMTTGRGGELYDRFVRQAPAHLVMATPMAAEKSRAANNRIYAVNTAFESYAQGTAARLLEIGRQIREAPNHRARMDAVSLFNRNLFGAVAAGSGTIALRTFLAFGVLGLVQKAREAQEDPVDFLGEAVMYSWFGGMFEAVRRSAMGESTLQQSISGVVPAVSIYQELADLANGKGRYEDMSMVEKAAAFGQNQIAAWKPAERAMAVIGLGSHDNELDLAITSYYRFIREQGPGVSTGERRTNDEDAKAFRREMRKAADMLKGGADPDDSKLLDHLIAAAVAKGSTQSVAEALKARRFLTGSQWSALTPAEQEKLQRTLGPELMGRLASYDAVLDALAGAFR